MKKIGIIEYALKYHRIVVLFVSVLVLVGIYGLYVSPKQDFPTFTIRQGVVVGIYPGATSYEIEEQITKPLEDFVFSYKEIRKDKTFSQSKSGLVVLNIELDENLKDKDAFWSKFKHGLDVFKEQLPDGLLSLQAYDDFGETSAILMTLESKDKSYRELERFSDDLKDGLRKIEGISNLRTFGILKEQVSLYVDQEKLSHYGISIPYMMAKLQSQTQMSMSGGINNHNFKSPIHIDIPLNWERDIAEEILYSDQGGNLIRVKDIAKVIREYPRDKAYIKNNGVKSLLLSVEMKRGADIVKIGREVNEELDVFKDGLPSDVKISKITDLSKVVGDSVNSFLKEIIIAITGVLLVVVVFLSLRTALVAASTIPITIFCALAVFYAFGIEINTIILSALIVTLGMVVDDSIVIIDNYIEKVEEGTDRWEAAVSSPKKYFKSVLSATLVISVTFFPFLLTTRGMFNDFLVTYPWAMTIILGFSLLIALLFTPYLQYTFIKNVVNKSPARQKKRFTFFHLIQRGYNYLLTKSFSYPKTTLGIGVLIVITGMVLFFRLPLRLMPFVDRNQFAVEIYLPNGKSIHRTEMIADSMEHILRRDARVLSVTSFIGQGSPRFHDTYVPQMASDNFAQFIVNTKSSKATTDLLDEYTEKYSSHFPEAHIRFKQMDFSEARYPIEIRLSGKDIDKILSFADTIMAQMRKNEQLFLIRTNYEEASPGVNISLNQEEMSRLGINRSLVAMNTTLATGDGIPVTKIWDKDYEIGLVLKSERGDSLNYDDLSEIYIPVSDGRFHVPLRQIATISPSWNVGQIVRRNGIRTLSILAEVKRGENEIAVTNQLKDNIGQLSCPSGISVDYGGMFEADNERLPQIVGGLLISVSLMFFILIFHFRKISLAFLALGSTMLAFLGTSLGMMIMDVSICVTSILGVVSLMGILLRNGIIMLDYAEDLRRNERMSVRDAAFQAGMRRLRPIFLTSSAAAVGVVPMLLGGSPLWTPLGAVIFYGTLITMVFISVILPIAYTVIYYKKDVSQLESGKK